MEVGESGALQRKRGIEKRRVEEEDENEDCAEEKLVMAVVVVVVVVGRESRGAVDFTLASNSKLFILLYTHLPRPALLPLSVTVYLLYFLLLLLFTIFFFK